MTFTEFFEQGYFYFAITLFGLTLVFITFFASLIKTKKLPFIQLVIMLLFIALVLFKPVCVWFFNVEPTLESINLDFDLYTTIVSAVLIVLSHIAYLACTSKSISNKSIYMLAPDNLGKPIYAYMTKKGKVLKFTDKFFEEFNHSFKRTGKWYKKVNTFAINGTNYNYLDFLMKLKEMSDETFKVTFTIEDDVTFNMEKIAIEEDEEVIGYILAAKNVGKVINSVDGFACVITDLSFPYAYYNDDSRGVVYTINESFKNLLGIKGFTLGYEELRSYVFEGDLTLYDSLTSSKESGKYYYRLQTNEGLKTFEEVKFFHEGNLTTIISLVLEKDEKLCDKKELVKTAENLFNENKEFGAVLIAINDVEVIKNQEGFDITKELVNKYINYLEKELLKDGDVITKISDMEYCIIFNDILSFDAIVRDISKNSSALSQYTVQYEDEKYTLKNILGLVYSESIYSTNELMNALEEALSFANKENYSKNYSIYSSVPKAKKNIGNIGEYRFEDYKIDLDNSFLDDDKE